MQKAIQIHTRDNVATITGDIAGSEEVGVLSSQGELVLVIKLKEKIPYGHKLAIRPIGIGDKIVKYGETIGIASAAITAGEWVHTHNVISDRMSEDKRQVRL